MRRLLAFAGFCGILAALALPAGGGATLPGPNGLIVFRGEGNSLGQLWTIRPDGTDQQQITNLPGDSFLPHWSPESNRIVFEFDPVDTAGNTDFCNIATMNRNGGGVHILPLANGDVCEASPTFSADGHRIYYEGTNFVDRDAIYSMDRNGNDRRFVSDCQGTGVTDPEVSPDGTMISFTCFNDTGSELFDANIDGSGLRQLTFVNEVGNKSDWSPDSQRIMFISISGEDPNRQINTFTISRNGGAPQAVTHYPPGGPRALGNSYSPDGNWIVMRIEEGPDLSALFKIQPDGNGLTQITPFSTFRPRNMAWGTALANAGGHSG